MHNLCCLGLVSEFSKLLSDAVAASGLTQAEVEQRTGIDRTALSRLMSGALVPSRINLERLFSKFQPGTRVGHELVFAHLRDEAAAAGIQPSELRISLGNGDAVRERLPVSLVADLDLIAAEVETNKDFASMVGDWATIIRNHHTALSKRVVEFPAAKARLPRGRSQETTA